MVIIFASVIPEKLLDGQHRLLAVVASGMQQTWNIQTGLPDETFKTMDIGKTRTGGDTVAVMGFKHHNVMASAIRLVALYNKMKQKRFSPQTNFSLTNAEIAEWLEKNGGERIQECVRQGCGFYSQSRFINQSVYAGLLYIFGNKNKEEAELFFTLLASGENIGSNNYSMIYLLRQKLINIAASKFSFKNAGEKNALIIKAWNYFRDSREIKSLTWQSDREDFPLAK